MNFKVINKGRHVQPRRTFGNQDVQAHLLCVGHSSRRRPSLIGGVVSADSSTSPGCLGIWTSPRRPAMLSMPGFASLLTVAAQRYETLLTGHRRPVTTTLDCARRLAVEPFRSCGLGVGTPSNPLDSYHRVHHPTL